MKKILVLLLFSIAMTGLVLMGFISILLAKHYLEGLVGTLTQTVLIVVVLGIVVLRSNHHGDKDKLQEIISDMTLTFSGLIAATMIVATQIDITRNFYTTGEFVIYLLAISLLVLLIFVVILLIFTRIFRTWVIEKKSINKKPSNEAWGTYQNNVGNWVPPISFLDKSQQPNAYQFAKRKLLAKAKDTPIILGNSLKDVEILIGNFDYYRKAYKYSWKREFKAHLQKL